MEDIMAEKTVDEIVEEAKKPGTFNIINVLKERSHPTDNVSVYLDEKTAYEAAMLKVKLGNTDSKANEYAKIQSEIDALIEKLESEKYVFVITGISEGRREEIYNDAVKKFPVEYEESTNPFSGEKTKEEVENAERDRLFTSMLWKEHISKIVAPDGSEQTELSLQDIAALRATLPIAASGTINQAVEKLRAATAVFMLSVDEDFLAKS
jgi:hypothetical protein